MSLRTTVLSLVLLTRSGSSMSSRMGVTALRGVGATVAVRVRSAEVQARITKIANRSSLAMRFWSAYIGQQQTCNNRTPS